MSQGYKTYLAASRLPVSSGISGLTETEQGAVVRLANRLQNKAIRNDLRSQYYDHHSGLKDLGLTMPPAMRDMETVLGWPAKAVDAMVRRTVLDRWDVPAGSTADDIGLTQISEQNRLDSELPGALTSCLVHSCAFGFVSRGDTSIGEPEALLTVRSARDATATWDPRRRAVSEALAVTAWENGQPVELTLYLPGVVTTIRNYDQAWYIDRQPVPDGDVPVELIAYKPLLHRRFGYSRISRPVMSLTDQAVRVLARTEVAAEFFNTPQRYALGADEKAFRTQTGDQIPGWKLLLGHLWTLSRDADGELPQVGQFPQQSMQPNVEHLRMITQMFAAETSLPLRSLGIVGDNPESAEAISEANRELELEIRNWQKVSLTPALRRLMGRALRILNGPALSPADWASLVAPHWQRPDAVSVAAATDAVVKLDSVAPGFGASQVGLEMAGLEPEQVTNFRAEQARNRGRQTLEALTGVADGSKHSGTNTDPQRTK